MGEKTVVVTLELSREEAHALEDLAKRSGFADCVRGLLNLDA